MSEIDNVIQITITRETAAVATASFNIPLVLATFTNFSERVRTYTDMDEVAEDFADTTNVYKMASGLFGQDIRPPQILVGRRQVDAVDGTVPTATVGAVYSVIVNGTTYSYTAISGDDAADIVAGMKAQYDLAPKAGITFTDNTDGTFDFAVSVAGTAWSLKSTSNVILSNTSPTETWPAALTAVSDVNDTWYCLTAEVHTEAEQQALASAIQSQHKMYITSSSDVEMIASTTGDIASLLNAASISRTATMYCPTADTEFPECAWVGGMLPRAVGSASWNFKIGRGVTVANLSATALTNLNSKKANRFTVFGGQNVFREGLMADGRPISEIQIMDWIYARMQEQIAFRLINLPKIPFTRAGFAIIEGEMRSVLQQMKDAGGIDTFDVNSPDPLAIPLNQRAQGVAGTFTFTARLTNEVRTIVINGNLTI